MNRSRLIYIIGAMFFMVVLVYSCDHQNDRHHGEGVMARLEEHGAGHHGTSISSEQYIADIKTIEVTEDGITFLIPSRLHEITSYECSECHSKPLPENLESPRAHWNIKLNHADETTMTCRTCHSAPETDQLTSLTGKSIDFEHSYRQCAQCHQKQKKDWSGGAHGKRMISWASPRLSMTCVNCHNPHSPGFEPRLPSTYNSHRAIQRK